MKQVRRSLKAVVWATLVALFCPVLPARAQNCQTSTDLDAATRTAITGAAQRYFEMSARGDMPSLRQSSTPILASDFPAVEATIRDHQQQLSGEQASVKSVFLLGAEGNAPLPHAEFYCGVFGKNGQTAGSAEFFLDNLAAGTYAVVVLDATSPQARTSFSVVLKLVAGDWKLAGLYLKPTQIAGHDSDWFVARAREYKAKAQLHDAWLYYLEARSMISPLPIMDTLANDNLMEESQKLQPADFPANGKPTEITAGTATYRLTAVFPEAVGNDLDLIVRYDAADASNTNQAYQSNLAVIKALVAKYPELREAFAAVVARAVDPTGRDYGTLLEMKDIK